MKCSLRDSLVFTVIAFIASAGLFVSLNAHAGQETLSGTPWSGVWAGKIGKHPITACFNGGKYSSGTGSYYYKRYLQPIHLGLQNAESENAAAIWREAEGTWQLDHIEAETIRGTWSSSDQSRKLPIELSRIGSTPASSAEDCSSDAYNHALEVAASISKGQVVSTDSLQYRMIVINLGKEEISNLLSDQGLYLETLELIGDSPAFLSINKFLRKLLLPSRLFECRRAQLGSDGNDGFLTQTVESVSIVKNWLIVKMGHQGYCATAHNSIWETQHTWDMVTGQPENLLSWFKGGKSNEYDMENGYSARLPLPLAEFVYTRIGHGDPLYHLDMEEFQRCYGDFAPDQYRYQLALFDGGIIFIVPVTYNGSCGEFITLSFKELAPFLNKKGRAIAETFKQPHQQ
ncbi:MAG: hypothetical protein LBU53_11665 [Zoogloeaceae bacterium]|jgi:hypothetical protein|nr:hypothetical protein [Zoogloeaceae bacterium]